MAYASYRIATDGAFIHKVIEGNGFKFYFRDKEERPDEKPYAIAYGIPRGQP